MGDEPGGEISSYSSMISNLLEKASSRHGHQASRIDR
jgi:hypothetical protein